MVRVYFHLMLAQQAFERFGMRSFLQEHLFRNPPSVPIEVLLKSNAFDSNPAVVPGHDGLDNVLENRTAPEVGAVEVSAVEYESYP